MKASWLFCLLFVYQIHEAVQQSSYCSNQPPASFGYLNQVPFLKVNGSYLVNMTLDDELIHLANDSSLKTVLIAPTFLHFGHLLSLDYVLNNTSLANGYNCSTGCYIEANMTLGSCLVTSQMSVFDFYSWNNSFFNFLPPGIIGLVNIDIGEISMEISNVDSEKFYFCGQAMQQATFSIYLNGTGGGLIFGVDMTKSAASEPIIQFMGARASELVFDNIQIGNLTIQSNQASLLLDVAVDVIGMPSYIFEPIVNYLCDSMCSSCGVTNDSKALTTCNISSSASWPSINIFASGNYLPITPDIYLLNDSSSNISTTFNIIESPWDTLSLGPQVMEKYYTVYNLNLSDQWDSSTFSTVNLYPMQMTPGPAAEMLTLESNMNGVEVLLGLSEISDINDSDEAEASEALTQETDNEISGVSDDDYSIDESDFTFSFNVSNLNTLGASAINQTNMTVLNSTSQTVLNSTSQYQEIAEVKKLGSKIATMKYMAPSVKKAGQAMNGFTSVLSEINKGYQIAEPFLEALADCVDIGLVVPIIGSFLSLFKPSEPSIRSLMQQGFNQTLQAISDVSQQVTQVSQQVTQISQQVTQVSQQVDAVSQQVNQVGNDVATVSQQVDQVSDQVTQVEEDIFSLSNEIANATQDIESMMDQVSQQISSVMNQITVLQGEDQTYFDTLLQDTQADTCFATFSTYEEVITGAMQSLTFYMNNNNASLINLYQSLFVDQCDGCEDALEGLLNAFSDEARLFGCNIIDLLSKGDTTYHHNWQNQIATKGGYMISLIHMGFVVVSAYESIKTADAEVYVAIQNVYNASYVQAVQNLQAAIGNCYNNYTTAAIENLNNYVQEYPQAAMLDITNLLSELYPWKVWLVISLNTSTCPITNSLTNFSFVLPSSNQTLWIVSFDFNSGFGLANNQSTWLLGAQLDNCYAQGYGGSGSTGYALYCGQIAVLDFQSQTDILVGTNLINAQGGLYNVSEFIGGVQTEIGIDASVFYYTSQSYPLTGLFFPSA